MLTENQDFLINVMKCETPTPENMGRIDNLSDEEKIAELYSWIPRRLASKMIDFSRYQALANDAQNLINRLQEENVPTPPVQTFGG